MFLLISVSRQPVDRLDLLLNGYRAFFSPAVKDELEAEHWTPSGPKGYEYRLADNSRPVSFTVRAWEWVYATNLSRLQSEKSKRHVGEAHNLLTTAILLPQRLSWWGKIVSLRMLADLRLTTAQQRTTGQNLPSNLYVFPSSIFWAWGSIN
jgi:hypothetical protein